MLDALTGESFYKVLTTLLILGEQLVPDTFWWTELYCDTLQAVTKDASTQ